MRLTKKASELHLKSSRRQDKCVKIKTKLVELTLALNKHSKTHHLHQVSLILPLYRKAISLSNLMPSSHSPCSFIKLITLLSKIHQLAHETTCLDSNLLAVFSLQHHRDLQVSVECLLPQVVYNHRSELLNNNSKTLSILALELVRFQPCLNSNLLHLHLCRISK